MFILRPILIRVVIPADQGGQIPARVLQPSHNAQKSGRSFADGDRRYGMNVVACDRCASGAERGSTPQVGPRSPAERRSGSSLSVKGAAVAGELARRANRSGLLLPTRLAFVTS